MFLQDAPRCGGVFFWTFWTMKTSTIAAARAGILLLLLAGGGDLLAQGDPRRGEYLIKAGGCQGCHTGDRKDAPPFAGGRALKTPFGTFYGPNITPHPQAGIGKWTEADFVRAMRHGRRPDGANYFPAFPYPSYTLIVDTDLRDLWAYLRTLPQSSQASREHDVPLYFRWRFLITFWKWFFFTPGPFAAIPGVPDIINRGAYLVQALGHCGECHTPRNFLGGPRRDRSLAGGKGPEGKEIPNLTPANLKKWTDKELQEFMTSGQTPDGDAANQIMEEVIRNTTSQLTPQDLSAMIAYLRSLPPAGVAP
jgi:mono/diheme cytochrome c family protein